MKRRRFQTQIADNIAAVWRAARADEKIHGMRWYWEAHHMAQALAHASGKPIELTAAVIASLSPQLSFERTLAAAAATLAGRWTPEGTLCTWRRTARILVGEPPLEVFDERRMPKVRSFYINILDPARADAVTIDRHAKCLALNLTADWGDGRKELGTVRKGAEYRHLARHYFHVAERLGVKPNQLQAVTWLVWRRKLKEGRKTNGHGQGVAR